MICTQYLQSLEKYCQPFFGIFRNRAESVPGVDFVCAFDTSFIQVADCVFISCTLAKVCLHWRIEKVDQEIQFICIRHTCNSTDKSNAAPFQVFHFSELSAAFATASFTRSFKAQLLPQVVLKKNASSSDFEIFMIFETSF